MSCCLDCPRMGMVGARAVCCLDEPALKRLEAARYERNEGAKQYLAKKAEQRGAVRSNIPVNRHQRRAAAKRARS